MDDIGGGNGDGLIIISDGHNVLAHVLYDTYTIYILTCNM